jgi:hypothetical protein
MDETRDGVSYPVQSEGRTERSDQLITADQLASLDACGDHVRVFRQEWPDGMGVTLENVRRAVVLRLDIEWASRCLLTPEEFAVYNKAMAQAITAYDKAMDQASRGPGATYIAAEDRALAAYHDAEAAAFLVAWTSQA